MLPLFFARIVRLLKYSITKRFSGARGDRARAQVFVGAPSFPPLKSRAKALCAAALSRHLTMAFGCHNSSRRHLNRQHFKMPNFHKIIHKCGARARADSRIWWIKRNSDDGSHKAQAERKQDDGMNGNHDLDPNPELSVFICSWRSDQASKHGHNGEGGGLVRARACAHLQTIPGILFQFWASVFCFIFQFPHTHPSNR